jgi:hypothetical protein
MSGWLVDNELICSVTLYVFHWVTLSSCFVASSDSVNSELECRTTQSWFDLTFMPTFVLRTDARHEKISQDSLDTGYDMNPAYPGHEDAVLPTRSRPPIVASPTLVLCRTNVARVTAGQLHLLQRNYSLRPCLFQLFSGKSLLLVVAEPSWSRQRSCPVSFLYFMHAIESNKQFLPELIKADFLLHRLPAPQFSYC